MGEMSRPWSADGPLKSSSDGAAGKFANLGDGELGQVQSHERSHGARALTGEEINATLMDRPADVRSIPIAIMEAAVWHLETNRFLDEENGVARDHHAINRRSTHRHHLAAKGIAIAHAVTTVIQSGDKAKTGEERLDLCGDGANEVADRIGRLGIGRRSGDKKGESR